jgi:hypothetical protein
VSLSFASTEDSPTIGPVELTTLQYTPERLFKDSSVLQLTNGERQTIGYVLSREIIENPIVLRHFLAMLEVEANYDLNAVSFEMFENNFTTRTQLRNKLKHSLQKPTAGS